MDSGQAPSPLKGERNVRKKKGAWFKPSPLLRLSEFLEMDSYSPLAALNSILLKKFLSPFWIYSTAADDHGALKLRPASPRRHRRITTNF